MPTCKAASSCRMVSLTRSVSAVLLAIAVFGLSGCQQASSPSAVPISDDSPESKLEEIMNRLRTAVVDASAAAGSGVVSQRTVSHRLIPPDGDKDRYRAKITIKTTVALANPPASATRVPEEKSEEEAEEEALDPLAEEEEMPDPLLEDSAKGEATAGEEELPSDGGISRRTVEESRETTTKTYELVYDNERWKLVDEISDEEDEVAKYLFEYALEE